MSRSGYYDDDGDDYLALGRWRGMVASSLRGKRGQAFLRELAANLDAMPAKRLIAQELRADGEFCTLGVLGAARGIELDRLDPEDYESVAAAFGIAPCMAQEIVYENDEAFDDHEWVHVEICGPMRSWKRHKDQVRVMRKTPRNSDGNTCGIGCGAILLTPAPSAQRRRHEQPNACPFGSDRAVGCEDTHPHRPGGRVIRP